MCGLVQEPYLENLIAITWFQGWCPISLGTNFHFQLYSKKVVLQSLKPPLLVAVENETILATIE